MKRRIRKVANFFAFNLLFFALYLNFIHKDKIALAGTPQNIQPNAAFSGTVLVNYPEQVLEKKNDAAVVVQQPAQEKAIENNTAALKLKFSSVHFESLKSRLYRELLGFLSSVYKDSGAELRLLAMIGQVEILQKNPNILSEAIYENFKSKISAPCPT